MRTVSVGNPPRVIGGDEPLACVPILPVILQDIEEQAAAIAKNGIQPDIVEMRIDPLMQFPPDAVRDAIRAARRRLGHGMPVLLTNRSAEEGGMAQGDSSAQISFFASVVFGADIRYHQAFAGDALPNMPLKIAVEPPLAELIDVELRCPAEARQWLMQQSHALGMTVIASLHRWDASLALAEIQRSVQLMEQCGADIAKVAVMPSTPSDVLEFMRAIQQIASDSSLPIIAMAMGPLGGLSRLGGSRFGSSVTFATIGPPSAPGQLPIHLVREYWHYAGVRQLSPKFSR